MYASFYDAGQELNDEDFREYILALKDYALYGIEYTSQIPMVNALITMAQPLLEAAAKRRAKQVKNGEFGILGGRKRKGETAEEYKARKEALRQSLNKSKTLNNPMGFQNETLNVDVDVKVNENVDAKANDDEYLNVNINADVDADVDVTNNSILNNSNISSLTSKPGLDCADYSNESGDILPSFDEGLTLPPVLQRNNVIIPKETSDNSKELVRFRISRDRMVQLMDFEHRRANSNKSRLIQEIEGPEDYHEKTYNILDNDLPVIRHCLEYLNRGKGERIEAARDKVHELIMNQAPESEADYIEILRELWEFYIKDRAIWDSRKGKPVDEYNPYSKMKND